MMESFKDKNSGGGYKRNKKNIKSKGNIGTSFGGGGGDGGGGYRREASEDTNSNFGREDTEQGRIFSTKRENDIYRGKRLQKMQMNIFQFRLFNKKYNSLYNLF